MPQVSRHYNINLLRRVEAQYILQLSWMRENVVRSGAMIARERGMMSTQDGGCRYGSGETPLSLPHFPDAPIIAPPRTDEDVIYDIDIYQ
jgi:hypothetical protein